MSKYVKAGGLQVAECLYQFIEQQALPGSGVEREHFWSGLTRLIHELEPINKALLHERDRLQDQIHQWHREHRQSFDFTAYKQFLSEIGYLEPEVDDFRIGTQHVDDEIAQQAGPQLVVPVNNARYALNAANARWGSLYDALYGTNVIADEPGSEAGSGYNPKRGERVIAYAKQVLDQTVPLMEGSHADVARYDISAGQLQAVMADGSIHPLADPLQWAGYQGEASQPTVILFRHHGLHLEIQIDREHPIGATDRAGIKDIVLESALTTIMDCEDSVTAVDAEDKVLVYSNWLGLMNGSLEATFEKGGQTVVRKLNPDRTYTAPDGTAFDLRGRSLLFVRNVGHLMTIDAILTEDGQPIREGVLDGVMTALIAKHDLSGRHKLRNSRQGSVYIVKPKMHGSREVAFANTLFDRIEDLLGLPRHTLKIGVMDEERRTSLNLRACIREVRDRIAFINTGFLDRTGDEMHTSMEAGPMIRKNDMKSSQWLQAYEQSNVQAGLRSGFQGRAQIGKGMWAMPDLMREMLEQKGAQLSAGANTAWVPSPTAATLHALHYHQTCVEDVQHALLAAGDSANLRDGILQIPIANSPQWSAEEVRQELDNNAQGILGYVVRWVEQGIGCSKVPDINNVGLMEDRATLRISSQHVANWLHHGICTKEQVLETMKRMAKVVDAQNAQDPHYRPMSVDYERSIAFAAALDLVFLGYEQPSGYTEPILHRRRLELKRRA